MSKASPLEFCSFARFLHIPCLHLKVWIIYFFRQRLSHLPHIQSHNYTHNNTTTHRHSYLYKNTFTLMHTEMNVCAFLQCFSVYHVMMAGKVRIDSRCLYFSPGQSCFKARRPLHLYNVCSATLPQKAVLSGGVRLVHQTLSLRQQLPLLPLRSHQRGGA